MTRKELVQFIREELMKVAIEELKKPKIAPNKIEEPITEDEIDEILFFAGDKDQHSKHPIRSIRENSMSDNKIKVSESEINDFESNFKKNVNPAVIFNKQQNGYSLYLYKGPNGVEAKASGFIKFNATNEIKWQFSIQNGVYVTASLKLDDDNYDTIGKLYQFYGTWQKQWSNKLSGDSQDVSDQDTVPQGAGVLPQA